MVCSITAVAALNSTLAALDHWLYGRRVARVELAHSPLFILGHWRSGTTYLHELLIRDPAHTYPSTYQCFVPHHFVLSQRWLAPLTEMLLPRRRPMDNMAAGWNRPQEDEFALCNLGAPTPYLSMMFPDRGEVFPQYLDLRELSENELQAWRSQLLRFFQRLAFQDNRRIIVKSPPHTARVRTLLEMFPTAKFVHLVRDPYDLYASTVGLWKSLNEMQGVHVPRRQRWIDQYVLSALERMYAAFEQDRQLLGDAQLYELRYEDLVDDPLGQLRQLYSQLALGEFSRAEPAVQGYLAEVSNYRTNRHELTAETRRTVREHWSNYFEQYGYDVQSETVDV